jgi:hypothetical protein
MPRRDANGEYEVDSIVYATGFDAMTGTLSRLNITGRDGPTLAEKWSEGGLGPTWASPATTSRTYP